MFTTSRCFLYTPMWRHKLVAKKVTQASKGLGTNSVGLATELSLVSKLLQKVIPKKIFASGYVRLPRTFSCKVRTPSAGQESTTNIKTYTTSKSNSQGRHYLSPPASRERFITEVRELSCFCVASVFANIWSVLIVKNWGQKKAHWNGIDVVLKASKYVVSLRS